MSTNITEQYRHALLALTSGDYGNFSRSRSSSMTLRVPQSSPSTSARPPATAESPSTSSSASL